MRPSGASGVKRIVIELREEDHELLKKLKGNKTWRDFIFELVEFKQRIEGGKEEISKNSLKDPYRKVAEALSELAKLMVWEEEGIKQNEEFYFASLLPLLVSGGKVEEGELSEFYIFITNLLFNYIRDKYKDFEKAQLMFEYMRVAIIRELRGDIKASKRLLEEVCKVLGKLS